MKIQVLVATTRQSDYSLIKKMNIKTDAIIGNQCDKNSVDEFEIDNMHIVYLNFAEHGVGLNRNNTLMRANADICLFADDDIIYEDDYREIVEKSFNNLRYGTVRIAVRLSSVKKYGIYFNQCFGGGTERCHGEDTLFLSACLKNGLKIVAVPEYIATLTDERESSWNNGYNEKYIKDQGVLYYTISRKWWRLLCIQDAIRKHRLYNRSMLNTYLLMLEEVKKFKKHK